MIIASTSLVWMGVVRWPGRGASFWVVAATGTAKVGSLKKQLRQTEAECAELATQLAVCTHGYNLLSILNDRTLQLSALPSLEREREKDYNKSKNKNERLILI